MTETPTVGLKLKIFVSPFLSKSLPPGVQEKRKKLGGRSAPPSRVLKVQNILVQIGLKQENKFQSHLKYGVFTVYMWPVFCIVEFPNGYKTLWISISGRKSKGNFK